MARQRRRQELKTVVPDLTPLIDVVFILIVFFLVATTFYTEERDLKIELPEGTEGTMVNANKESFVINVHPDGTLVVDQKVLTVPKLEVDLRNWVKKGQKAVEIRGDTNTPHGKMMNVMNLCKKTGVANYSLTQRIVQKAPK